MDEGAWRAGGGGGGGGGGLWGSNNYNPVYLAVSSDIKKSPIIQYVTYTSKSI